MMKTDFVRRMARSAVLATTLMTLMTTLMTTGAQAMKADTLTDNLSASTAGVETASGDTWLTASFGTDAASYTLSDVTLLLDSTDSGTAAVSIYSDGLLSPGSLVGTLTSSASIGNSLTPTTFSTSGLSLPANATYWVVLQATAGSVDWAWTEDNSGTGVGYQGTWGISNDAGATWFTDDTYPTQLSVEAAVANAATPEPDTLTMTFAGALLVGVFFKTIKGGKR